MFRALWSVLLLGSLAILAMWLADNPGEVSVTWHGYVIETSAAVLVCGVLIVIVLFAILDRFWVLICSVPAGISWYRGESRRRKGYLALSRGMVAVAAGDPSEASQQVRRADDLLKEPSLTLLLSAQSAQLTGDEDSAHKFFTQMLRDPDTEFLGLRGLLNQAIKKGDNSQALKFVRQAYKLKPESDWVVRTMFDLSSRAGLWREAYEALDIAVQKKQIDPLLARHSRAVLNHQISLEAMASGNDPKALKFSKKANKEELGFTPAQINLSLLLMSSGKQQKAIKTLEAAWAIAPHPEIASAYWKLNDTGDIMARLKVANKLASFNPKNPASKLMLAKSALDAGLWADARKYLEEVGASTEPVTINYCQLMAKLEETENSDMFAAREWLVRAAHADADPLWVCQDCGNATETWSALCGACGGFDKLQWGRPSRIPGLGVPIEAGPQIPRLVPPASGLTQDIDENGTEQ